MSAANASIWPADPATPRIRESYARAAPRSYWFDTVDEPFPVWRGAAPAAGAPARELPAATELAIVGGGLTGLWTALLAKERRPDREVVLLEGERIGFGATGRSGGFVSYSLTHGLLNGLARTPADILDLEPLGLANLAEIEATLDRYGIDCELALEGSLSVALTPKQLEVLPIERKLMRRFGHRAEVLDAEATRAIVDSPTYLGAIWHRSGEGLLNPVKLALGLRDAAARLGVKIVEGAQVERLESDPGGGVRLAIAGVGALRAGRVVLATAAFPGLLPEIRRRIVPVYDYVLVTEPLSPEQREAVGWQRMIGVSDRGNQFHYYRPTADGRILWGGYDAIYGFRNGLGPAHDQRERSFARLASHFFHTFPRLEGLRFSHRWGGPIDTCARFFAFYGTALDGRVAYAVGHTGLGIGASRFAAGTALDLLYGGQRATGALRLIGRQPPPFPPEPLRWAVIELTRNRLAAADRSGGGRGLWLRTLDRFGLGFNS